MSDESGPKNDAPEPPQAGAQPAVEELPWARITVRQVDDKGRVQIQREYFPKGQASPDHAAHGIVFDLCQYLEAQLVKKPDEVAKEKIEAYTGPRGLEEMKGPSDLTH